MTICLDTICSVLCIVVINKLILLGGYRERVTPVPIPNTEVKPLIADGTARVAVWESRTLPGFEISPINLYSRITPLCIRGVFYFSILCQLMNNKKKPMHKCTG